MSASKFNKLGGARVLIVGGSSGIGFSVAEGAIEYGATVVIASSNAKKIEAAVERLRSSYPDRKDAISGTTCDLFDFANVEKNVVALCEFVTKDGKKIDHVVNTAGTLPGLTGLADFQPDSTKFLSQRVTATLMLAKVAPKYMEEGPQASFVVTTGTLCSKPIPNFSTAIAGVAAVEATMRALALDLAPRRVNAVSPGAIDTEMLQSMGNGNQEVKDATYKAFRESTVLKTIGQPEETAEAYLYLMKDRYVTGQTILTDGGRLMV